MVRFKSDKTSYGDESVPLEYLLGDGYHGYFMQEPRQYRPPLRPDQELLASLNRRERAELATRVLLSRKDAEEALKRAVLRSRARDRAKRQRDEGVKPEPPQSQGSKPDRQRKRFLQVSSGSVGIEPGSASEALKGWRVSRETRKAQAVRLVYGPTKDRAVAAEERRDLRLALARRFASTARRAHVHTVREESRLAAEAVQANQREHLRTVRERTQGLREVACLSQEVRAQLLGGSRPSDPMATAQMVRAILRHGIACSSTCSAGQRLEGSASWTHPSSTTVGLDVETTVSETQPHRQQQHVVVPQARSTTRRKGPGASRMLGGGFRIVLPHAPWLQPDDDSSYRQRQQGLSSSLSALTADSATGLPPLHNQPQQHSLTFHWSGLDPARDLLLGGGPVTTRAISLSPVNRCRRPSRRTATSGTTRGWSSGTQGGGSRAASPAAPQTDAETPARTGGRCPPMSSARETEQDHQAEAESQAQQQQQQQQPQEATKVSACEGDDSEGPPPPQEE